MINTDVKLFELINEGKFESIVATMPDFILDDIKKWYDFGFTYKEIADKLNRMIGEPVFTNTNAVKLLNNIYPDRPLRKTGGWKDTGNEPGLPSKFRGKEKVTKSSSPDYTNEIIKMYTDGFSMEEISNKFSRSKGAIHTVLMKQPNYDELTQIRRSNLNKK